MSRGLIKERSSAGLSTAQGGVVAFNEQLHMVAVRYSPNNLS